MYVIPIIEGQLDISINSPHPDNVNLLHFDSLEAVFRELIIFDSPRLPKWPQDSVVDSRSNLLPTFKKYLAQQSSWYQIFNTRRQEPRPPRGAAESLFTRYRSFESPSLFGPPLKESVKQHHDLAVGTY